MQITDKIKITNEDNMELMARYPDNYFDLAIVDPPYGIDVTKMTLGNGKKKIDRGTTNWDSNTPSPEYFMELRRVSVNQIVWGANYMTENLPPSMGWIYWDKGTGLNDFSDGELAYTSFNKALRSFKVSWVGANANNGTPRIHPTEKPIKLYEWILDKYAVEGQKILDTHLGSGSIAVAAHNRKFEFTACELDPNYFDASIKRLKNHISQTTLF
ncbi:adenine-specific DNA methyltransferase [Cellulophaga phage Nekkels_1]|uniref:Adenine-specific DNA methyltransferase n=1 Tax=Cellulophaga phage Nekkels_1 TaxID=2745692 RepID=A0A8E4UXJ5_9CAUD|nr:methyltransferase [Cellulophaga phage Nekkels_1]QQO97093.1 adenine-specific DNA methyltransferase [Cellulophaga phage Nekkels_1]QQO97187.1 adenine-specific DNA methyltransferase [Cellulophaga phage Nekkels_2]